MTGTALGKTGSWGCISAERPAEPSDPGVVPDIRQRRNPGHRRQGRRGLSGPFGQGPPASGHLGPHQRAVVHPALRHPARQLLKRGRAVLPAVGSDEVIHGVAVGLRNSTAIPRKGMVLKSNPVLASPELPGRLGSGQGVAAVHFVVRIRTSRPATRRKWASSLGPTRTPQSRQRAVAATAMSFWGIIVPL